MTQPFAPGAFPRFPLALATMPINDFACKRRDAYDEIRKQNCISWDPRPGRVLPGRLFRPGSTDVQSSRITAANSA